MKKALVAGGGGFIGSHLVSYLKRKKYYVVAVDVKSPEYGHTDADLFILVDLANISAYQQIWKYGPFDEVYNLAAMMGGMGFISKEHLASFNTSNLINIYLPEACALLQKSSPKIFFSSSACVYPIHKQDSLEKNVMLEEDAYPANPNEAYGWEKLVAEMRYKAYSDKYGLKIAIARFENCYGPKGTYKDGKEKAPAALCRKVALAKDGDEIEVWGDGLQTRSFMHVSDCVEGIYKLMQSDYQKPLNLGSEEVVSINELAALIIKISGKKLTIKNVEGPQGVRSRYIDHTRANNLLGWKAQISLEDGLRETYEWIKKRIAS